MKSYIIQQKINPLKERLNAMRAITDMKIREKGGLEYLETLRELMDGNRIRREPPLP